MANGLKSNAFILKGDNMQKNYIVKYIGGLHG
jgi:hypothetical protein